MPPKDYLDRRKPGAALWRSRHGSDPKPHSPLFRSRCGSGGPDVCGVDKPSVGIQQPLRLQSDLQPTQDAVEGAVVRPDAVPVVRALSGTVSLRKVPPRSTTAQNPQDGVEHLPGVTPLASGGLRRREKIANELPLPLVEFVPFYHKGSIAAERLVGVLRQALGFGRWHHGCGGGHPRDHARVSANLVSADSDPQLWHTPNFGDTAI